MRTVRFARFFRTLFACLLALALLLGQCAALGESGNWYEIFVRSFRDGDGDGLGDLAGLREELPYIRDMGWDGLWLMPVMPSPSYHKYDVTDYCAVDPQYGTAEDFRALTEACHADGIRVIVDLSVNHTSTQHPWFAAACDALRAGDTENPYVDYYHFTREEGDHRVPVSGTEWFYEEQFAGGAMPDLNLDSDAVRAEIVTILRFWLEEMGADGFRLDAVTSYYTGDRDSNVAFLAWLKEQCEAIRPGSFLVGEAWTGLQEIAEYYASGVDGFFLFPASQGEGYIAKALNARDGAASWVSSMERIAEALGDAVPAPFLCNHDTGRAVGAVRGRGSLPRAKFGEALLGLIGGNTFTYYGDEIGMAGSGDDPNKRLAMDWGDGNLTQQPPGVTSVEYPYPGVAQQAADPDSLLNYCRALNRARAEAPGFAFGKTSFPLQEKNLLVIRKEDGDAVSFAAVNFSAKESQSLKIDVPGLTQTRLLTVSAADEASVLLTDTGAELTLPPYGIAFLW